MHSVQRREKNGSISIKPFAHYFKTNDSWIRKKILNFSHQHFIFDFFIRRAFRTRVRYDGHISGCFTSVGQAESHPQVMSTLQARHRWKFSDYHNYLITLSYWHFSTIGSLWMKKSSCISMFPCTLTMSQFGLDPHRPARALKVEGVPKLSVEQNGIFLTANNSKVIKYEPCF